MTLTPSACVAVSALPLLSEGVAMRKPIDLEQLVSVTDTAAAVLLMCRYTRDIRPQPKTKR